MKIKSQSTQCWKMKLKRKKKKNSSQLELIYQIWDQDNPMKNKSWSLIFNQPNIKE